MACCEGSCSSERAGKDVNSSRWMGIAKAIADACAAQSERLAKMAVEETGFGIWQDKVLKNLLGSAITWDSVKDMKTVGIHQR